MTPHRRRAVRCALLHAVAATLIVACTSVPAVGGGASGATGISAYPPRDLARRTPQTRAERSAFRETSTHADVLAFLDSLKAMSAEMHVTAFGTTSRGRDLPLVVLSRPLVRTPAEARRLNRPVIFVQGNIHGGEVEGKEALLSILRDLTLDRYQNVLDSIVLVALPIYNADGNDSLGPQERNRGSQQGPALIGQRANGQGLDLNRDYMKAEAPETRASLQLFRDWDPDVFVDLHTTNGSYHGYALTWAPSLNPAAIFTGPFTRDTILPALQEMLQRRLRMRTFPYGNFARDSIERGWFTYDHRPRFGTNYYGIRGRIGILAEAYSHDPFERRIASTYGFVMELLSLLAANGEEVAEAGREADRRTTAFASTVNASPRVPIRARLTQTARVAEVLVEDVIRTGDTVRYEVGMPRGVQRTGRVRAVRVPVYDRFDPALEQSLPYAWAFSPEHADLVAPLRRHGVFVEVLQAPARVLVERFTIDSIARAPRPFQGHQETTLEGRWVTDSLTLERGIRVVRAGQPLGILALYLLEPQSDDGLATWNFLDPWISVGGRYPIARVMSRITAPLVQVP